MTLESSTRLDLWRQHLGRVPDPVWDWAELETLILADNRLIELSAGVGRLKSLRVLDLGHSELTSITESLSELVKLTSRLDQQTRSSFHHRPMCPRSAAAHRSAH
jgi:Leucine-rich repeat (LRR) protein